MKLIGDPRRLRKKLEGPRHPFDKTRIEEEIVLMGKYGLRNKKEIWKSETLLKKYRTRARASLAMEEEQQEQEINSLAHKLYRLGITQKEQATTDDILSLTIEQFLKRRLQSIIVEIGLADSPWQARQMIVHRHIAINKKKVTSPSYHVKRGEEDNIAFAPDSPYNDPNHPALNIATAGAQE